MKRYIPQVVLGLFLACALGACSNLGLQSPQTPEDGLRYGQAVITGAVTTVGNAAQDQTLPAADARKYYDQLNQARQDLEPVDAAARAAGGQIPPDMLGKLQLTLTTLNAIAADLRARLPASKTTALPAAKSTTVAR